MAAGTTMCNAGPPPYYAVFLISAQSTKVSMKKKKRKDNSKNEGRGPMLNSFGEGVCARVQSPCWLHPEFVGGSCTLLRWASSCQLSTRRHHCTFDFPSVFDFDIDIVNARCSNSSRTSVSKCKRILFHRVDRDHPPYSRLPLGVLSVAFRSLVRTSKQEFVSIEAANNNPPL